MPFAARWVSDAVGWGFCAGHAGCEAEPLSLSR